MCVIGMLGGMSYRSTITYYEEINHMVNEARGKNHCANLVVASMNFQIVADAQARGDWSFLTKYLSAIASDYLAQTDKLVMCTNTMHKIVPEIEDRTGKKFINLLDAVAKNIVDKGIDKVALLGTRFAMEDGFYQKKLSEYGIDVVVPSKTDRVYIHKTIYDKLCIGNVDPYDAECFLRIIKKMKDKYGIKGAVGGCTEIPLLIGQDMMNEVFFDTTKIHIDAIVKVILENG